MGRIDLNWSATPVAEFGVFNGVTKKSDYTPNAKKVSGFVNSQSFSRFCNWKENNVTNGCIMQIAVARENIPYHLCCNEYVEDFRINVRSCDGIRYYKASRYINKPSFGEKEIFYAATYWVYKTDGDNWQAVKLLDDEAWLDGSQVEAAFNEIAKRRGYLLTKMLMVGAGRSKAWRAEAVGSNGKMKELVCYLDNGRIVEDELNEWDKIELEPMKVLRTKFNYFRCQGNKKLVRE